MVLAIAPLRWVYMYKNFLSSYDTCADLKGLRTVVLPYNLRAFKEKRTPIVYSAKKYTQFALDTTNYCNARCVFCFNEWSPKRSNLTKGLFVKAIKVMPIVEDERFYFSCLYEPTLNPDFIDLLEMIPPKFRKKVFLTTNLVKYIPDEIIHRIAKVNINHINISLETFDSELYNKLTGTQNSHFFDNLERIVKIFKEYKMPPDIRFTTMILEDNFDELISLAKTARNRYNPTHHEFRTPYFFTNENTSQMEAQLLAREKVAGIVEKLEALSYANTCFDTRWDIEAYGMWLDSIKENPPPKISDSPSIGDFNTFNRIDHYTVRINSDGSGVFNGSRETFNLSDIRKPFSFFRGKLPDLLKLESEVYVNCNQSLLKTRLKSDYLKGNLDNVCVFAYRYLFLCGWLKPDKESCYVVPDKYIIINKSAVYRTHTENRVDIFKEYGVSNAGFTCCIDLKEYSKSAEKTISIEASILEDDVLKSTMLAEIPNLLAKS